MCPPEEEENNGSTPKKVQRIYAGMSYTELSKAGAELIQRASVFGNWHEFLDDLIEIRFQMRRFED